MADKRIDQLTAATSLGDSDLLVVEQESTAKKATGKVVADYVDDKFGLSEMASDVSTLKTEVDEKQNKLTFPIPISQGGTNATMVSKARENLGAASAEEVETKFGNIEDAILFDSNYAEIWGQGAISSTAGSNVSNNTRIRTIQISKTVKKVSAGDGFKYMIFGYEDGTTYVGTYNLETFAKVGTWLRGDTHLPDVSNYRFRIVLSHEDDSSITPDEYYNLKFYSSTDANLEEPGIAADAASTGLVITLTADGIRQAIGYVFGKKALWFKPRQFSSNTTSAKGETLKIRESQTIASAIEPCTEGDEFYISVSGPVGVSRAWYFTDEEFTVITFETQSNKVFNKVICAPAGAKFVIVQNRLDTNPEGYFAFCNNPVYNSAGLANTMANARHITSIKWTPKAGTMPKGQTSYYEQGVEYTGIPYSSVRDNDKAVGTNVSFRTFMTAVNDPRSVLYTRFSLTQNASTYYGTVCSGLVNYALGIGLHLTNYFYADSDWLEDVPMQDIQTGDVLCVPGHVAMVANVLRDQYAQIKSVTVIEEWAPLPRTVVYNSYKSFLSARDNYTARRFKNLDKVEYTPIDYVPFFGEDPAENIVYPDVQTDHGDAAVFVVGESVPIHVIDAKDYTQISVSLNGTVTQIITTIEDFTIPNVQAGLYTISATSSQNASTSTFFVVDCTGSFDYSTGVVTFSSTNATPVLVDVYELTTKDGKMCPNCKPIPLTDEDRSRGSINVSDYLDADYRYAKVTFNTPYGQVLWRSEDHQTWEPIT